MYVQNQNHQPQRQYPNFGLRLNQTNDSGIPHTHQDLPEGLNRYWRDINIQIRGYLSQFTNGGMELPGNYIKNVYSAGGWNNELMSKLQNLVAHWVLYEAAQADSRRAELTITPIVEAAVKYHVFMRFNQDLNTWMQYADPQMSGYFLQEGPQLDAYFTQQITPWLNQYFAPPPQQPQYNPQPYQPNPYAPQNSYQPQGGYSPNHTQQGGVPISSGMMSGRQFQPNSHPQELRPPVNTMTASAGSGIEELVAKRKPINPNQPTQTNTAQPTSTKPAGALFDESELIVKPIKRLKTNYGTFIASELPKAGMSVHEYNIGCEQLSNMFQRNAASVDMQTDAGQRALREYQAIYNKERQNLGIELVRGQYGRFNHPVKTHERPFDTKSQREMLWEVFENNPMRYIDIEDTLAMVIDNREYLLLPSSNEHTRIVVNQWRKRYQFTHNYPCENESNKNNYYRLIQYHPNEPIFIEDVVFEDPLMTQKEFDMQLHMPLDVIYPVEDVIKRTQAILARNPKVVVPETNNAPERDVCVINQHRMICSTAKQAINASHATSSINPGDVKLGEVSDKTVRATRYDAPNCYYLSTDKDKTFHNNFMADISHGALCTFDAISVRLKSAKINNTITLGYFNYLNMYLARRLFNMINYTANYRAVILDNGFVEEWETIKDSYLPKLPKFVYDSWKTHEGAYIREQFHYMIANEFNAINVTEYLNHFVQQLPLPKDATTGEILVPSQESADEAPTMAEVAEYFEEEVSTLKEMPDEEYMALVDQYINENDDALVPLKLTLENTAIILDQYVVYEVPYTLDDFGLLATYLADERAIGSDGHNLQGLVGMLNADLKNHNPQVKQQICTKDGYVLDIIRAITNANIFTFVLRESE